LDLKNLKNQAGIQKLPVLSNVPVAVLREVGVGMAEGGLKYGAYQYRDSRSSAWILFDATLRHLTDWWEGEDLDPDTGLSHLTKAICSLMVMRDAELNGLLEDDRPPRPLSSYKNRLEKIYDDIKSRYPNPKLRVTQKSNSESKDLNCKEEACSPSWCPCELASTEKGRINNNG
jgi:hypothetical protein